ncbi:OLC1v1015651C1 [Oldenlandia corymbosa var. corymbosa]|uniref:OLC1v1015651C1 n=1 Tax=Oldenlandia corymbosa var. corymbosa TaxID=529605 RepID=A0AAV1E5X0_OLDCO|nr:OLC1v1015651C1 [Oldenlandia corymbosa var. corymbosa]
MKITEEDVEAVLGLPRGPKTVVEAYDSRTSPKIKRSTRILSGRYFVLFFMASMLLRTKNACCRHQVMKSLMNVDDIKIYNWCKYVAKELYDAVEQWQKNPQGAFNGPVIFLILCYLDRVEYKDGDGIPRQFPVIARWDNDRVTKRLALERKGAGFGSGKPLDRIAVSKRMDEDEPIQDEEMRKVDDPLLYCCVVAQLVCFDAHPVCFDPHLDREYLVVHPVCFDAYPLFEEASETGIDGHIMFYKFFNDYAEVLKRMGEDQEVNSVPADQNQKQKVDGSQIPKCDKPPDPKAKCNVPKLPDGPSFGLGISESFPQEPVNVPEEKDDSTAESLHHDNSFPSREHAAVEIAIKFQSDEHPTTLSITRPPSLQTLERKQDSVRKNIYNKSDHVKFLLCSSVFTSVEIQSKNQDEEPFQYRLPF